MKKYSYTYKTNYSPQRSNIPGYNCVDLRPSSLGKRLNMRMLPHDKGQNKFRYDKMVTEYNGYGESQRIREKYDHINKKSDHTNDGWLEQENQKILQKRSRWEQNRFQNNKPCNQYMLSDKQNIQPYLRNIRKCKQKNMLTKQNYYQQESSEQLLSKYLGSDTHKGSEKYVSKQGYHNREKDIKGTKIVGKKRRTGLNEEKKQHKIKKENPPKFGCQVYLQKSTIMYDPEENEVFMEDSFGISQEKKNKEKQKNSELKKKEGHNPMKNQKYMDSLPINQTFGTTYNIKSSLPKQQIPSQNNKQQKRQQKNYFYNQKRNNQPYMLKSSDYKLKEPKTQLNIKYRQQNAGYRYEPHPSSNQHLQTQQKENTVQERRHQKRSNHKKFLSITSKSMDKYR